VGLIFFIQILFKSLKTSINKWFFGTVTS
jgi:hypothetical protein